MSEENDLGNKEAIAFMINTSMFKSPYESKLYDACKRVEILIDRAINRNDFDEALLCLCMIIEPLNEFLDNVIVKDKDDKIHKNRIFLVRYAKSLYNMIAKFEELEGLEDKLKAMKK